MPQTANPGPVGAVAFFASNDGFLFLVRNLTFLWRAEYKSLAACKSEAGKPYKSSPQKAKLQTYHLVLANPALALFICVPSGPDPADVRAIRLAGGGKIQLPAYRAFFLALGSIVSRQYRSSMVQPAAQTAQNTGKGRRSTIYEAYSRAVQGKAELFPLVIVGA